MRPRTSTLEPKKKRHTPERHILDRRAHKIAAEPSKDLLSTKELAEWLGVSEQWVEIGRGKNYGPKFKVFGPRMIRYRRVDVLAWLDERTYSCTTEYPAELRRDKSHRNPATA
jgi:hypothetical protein